MQDIDPNQLKLKLNDTYKKYEKITAKFETRNNEDVVHNAYLDTDTSKLEAQISFIKKIIMSLICLATNSLWKRSQLKEL